MGFLTGDPVAAVPTSSTTEKALPDWYTNYAQDILANQAAIAAQPYTGYSAPRVADFTPTQQAGFDQTEQAATAYQPGLAAATAAAGSVDPNAGLTAATPYAQQAGQTSASQVQGYLNPYTDQVVNQIGIDGNRTLQEQILPAIRDKFISGGSYGGTRNAEIFGDAVRDATSAISANQTAALESGYNTSLSAAGTDLNRDASLAGTVGSLGATGATTSIDQAGALASLAAQQQTLGLNGATAVQGVGQQQQNLDQTNLNTAYGDFQAQQAYPQQQNTALIGALQGVQPAVPSATLTSGQTVPSSFQPSDLATILSALSTAQGLTS